ncbi:MAG: RyR domain-containing protein [Huintestinicola sp.]
MKKIYITFGEFISAAYKILPFFLGMYCYYPHFSQKPESVYPFLDSVYASLKLYSGCTESGVTIDAVLQIARFLALAATLSILVKAFNKFHDIINRIKLLGRGSIVVYGSSVYADHLYESLKHSVRIRGGDKFIDHAGKYLIMFPTDKENLEFYSKNYSRLSGKRVYIMLEDTSRQSIEDPMITVFSVAENCARQYWRTYPVDKSERIAVIGFSQVGQNILTYGLQINIIDPSQHFEYHIYGDGSDFRRMHTELDKMLPDEIIFHDSGIYELEELSGFDRIIICGDENENISTVSRLLEHLPKCTELHVYAPNGDIMTKLFGDRAIRCFGLASDTASLDVILNRKSMDDARRQHAYYVEQYGGVPWEKLDAFKRYSNVSSSDYMFMINRLASKNVPFETLAELEHIRWCRYNYLHNWKYGEKRSDSERTHYCLVPFSELSEEEKLKDIEAIKSKCDKREKIQV